MSFDGGRDSLRSNARLRRLAALALPVRTFAVGGCVRDASLGRATKDLDVVVESAGERIAEAAAAQLPARLVRLGRERFAALRLIDSEGWIDLWDLRGGTLEDDLWRRDLSINAIAVDCIDGTVVDPTGGRADLELRRLRATRPAVFAEDPLRILRLVRFAVTLPGFSVDPGTAAAARSAASTIRTSATERVREELDRILEHPDLDVVLRWLLDLGIVSPLLGPEAEAPLREARIEDHRGLRPGVVASAPSPASAAPDSRAFWQWARIALAVRPDPAAAADWLSEQARRGLLSRAVLDRAIALLRPDWSTPSDAAESRIWLHQAGGTWPDAVALRAVLAEDGEAQAAWEALDRWIRGLTEAERSGIVEPRPLLDGEEIQQRLGIGPGPRVGELLAALRRAQVLGLVVDRAGAERLVDSRRDPSGGC